MSFFAGAAPSAAAASTRLASAARSRLYREYEQILRDPGWQQLNAIRVEVIESNAPWEWHVALSPQSGNYKGLHNLHLVFLFCEQFPEKPPTVTLSTTIPHSNVYGGWLCTDILRTFSMLTHSERLFGVRGVGKTLAKRMGWSPAYSVQALLIQIQAFLFDDWVLDGDCVRHTLWSACGNAQTVRAELYAAQRQVAGFRCEKCSLLAISGAEAERQEQERRLVCPPATSGCVSPGATCSWGINNKNNDLHRMPGVALEGDVIAVVQMQTVEKEMIVPGESRDDIGPTFGDGEGDADPVHVGKAQRAAIFPSLHAMAAAQQPLFARIRKKLVIADLAVPSSSSGKPRSQRVTKIQSLPSDMRPKLISLPSGASSSRTWEAQAGQATTDDLYLRAIATDSSDLAFKARAFPMDLLSPSPADVPAWKKPRLWPSDAPKMLLHQVDDADHEHDEGTILKKALNNKHRLQYTVAAEFEVLRLDERRGASWEQDGPRTTAASASSRCRADEGLFSLSVSTTPSEKLLEVIPALDYLCPEELEDRDAAVELRLSAGKASKLELPVEILVEHIFPFLTHGDLVTTLAPVSDAARRLVEEHLSLVFEKPQRMCFYTKERPPPQPGQLDTSQLLGFGVQLSATGFGTKKQAECVFDLLSHKAFYELNVRRAPLGQAIDLWFPLAMDRKHFGVALPLLRQSVFPKMWDLMQRQLDSTSNRFASQLPDRNKK
eukprot:g3310.t1